MKIPARSITRILLCAASLTLTSRLARAEPEKVIFDSDSSYFIDDIAALGMLLERPDKVKILGITLTSGNAWMEQGKEWVLRYLELSKNGGIPVYLGAADPLVHSAERAETFRKRWGAGYMGAFSAPRPQTRDELLKPFGGKFADLVPQSKSAVDFIIETVDHSVGDITLFVGGPMTNVALALKKKPDIAKKIKRLVFMGGAAAVPGNTTARAEFNIWFDPEAAQIVIASEIPQKVMIGLDATNQAVLTKKMFLELIQSETLHARMLKQDLGVGFPELLKDKPVKDWSYVWDCVASAYFLEPELFAATETMFAVVDAQFGPDYGSIIASKNRQGSDTRPISVPLGLDTEKFFKMFKEFIEK